MTVISKKDRQTNFEIENPEPVGSHPSGAGWFFHYSVIRLFYPKMHIKEFIFQKKISLVSAL